MLARQDIICISSIDWGFIWQGHQEVMATLAHQGNRVLFIENTGVRAPTFRDLPRLKNRVINWMRGVKGFRKERENLFVYSPLILPFPYSFMARFINRGLMVTALQRWMRTMGFRRPIIWTFLPTPLTLDLIRELDPALTVYYCIDDLSSSSAGAKKITRSETHLFQQADLVFVTSEKLRDRALRFRKQADFFPFGVDFEKFERIRKGTDEVPEDLRRIRKPVIGYVGGLHRWVDQELLGKVAAQMPEANFVLLGPEQADVSRLMRHRNVHFLGARPHDEVPRYTKMFDVGMVPYHIKEYTEHVYPTKLNEYLAMGVPVVATDLPEIRRFNLENGGVVAIANNPDEFARAVQKALNRLSPEAAQRYVEIARQNSWAERIAQMSELIKEQLKICRMHEDRWDISLRRLYRTAHRRVLKVAGWSLIVYLLFFQTPFVWMLAEPLRVEEPPRSADAIVVFAGGVGESGKAGGGYQERVKQAVELYEQNRAPRIIFSTGFTFVFHEANMMKELAASEGVPSEDILLETKAASTRDNVAFVSEMLHREQWNSILLVSSPYHMRRALLTWRRLASDIDVIAAPVPASQFYVHDRGASIEQIRGILHEYAAIIVYFWRGWI